MLRSARGRMERNETNDRKRMFMEETKLRNSISFMKRRRGNEEADMRKHNNGQ